MVIHDRLPSGITYIEGTARLDGAPVEPSSAAGAELSFAVGTLAPGAAVTLTYMAQVKAFADGKLVNIAFATGGTDGGARSNEARAVVHIRQDGDMFGDEGVVLGTVYIDVNGNGLKDRYLASDGNEWPEPGVPGIKIHFENGAFVVTDVEGRYSMPGLSPRTHVAALSARTLPATLEPAQTSIRDALSPQSRFVRLLPGEVASEYFALRVKPGVTYEEAFAELAERQETFTAKAAGGADSAARSALGGSGWIDYGQGARSDSREAARRTASEIVVYKGGESAAAPGMEEASAEPVSPERSRDLKAEVRSLTPELAFLDLKAEDVLRDDVISIRIKGPADGRLGLSLNGEPVPENQVGQHVVYAARGVQAAEYIAVRLEGGRNRLTATYSDPFGNVRGRQEIEVLAPGKPARIEIVAPPEARASPSSPVPVLVRLVDADGLPTYSSMDVTLEAGGAGEWEARDIRATEPGLQIFLDGGQALVDYFPPSLAGSHKIAVRNGLGRFETEIRLLPDDSERVVVGVIEGVVRLNDDDAISQDDVEVFEETTAGLEGALYLKGKIKGDALLTLRYDSDENTEERLFRDIDPDRYYPVYGDNSERGFDAQSDSQLYVKVEKGLNYILYGDVNVAAQANEFRLGNYSRALTGGQAHIEQGPVTINLFAGRTDRNRVIREFRAEGLSGPYDLDLSGYVEGSERVEVVTRDRRQPTIVLETVRLERYTDYRLDYFDDALLLNRPVSAANEAGNPNFIRVTYELDGEGDSYWVYAGEVRFRLNDRLAVGYREVHSDADEVYDDRRTVRAGYASADLGRYGRAEAEVAQSTDRLGEEGYAGRIGYEVANDRVILSAHAAHVDERFLEGSSNAASGRDEVDLEADWRLNSRLRLRTSLLYDRKLSSDDRRWGAEAIASWALDPQLTVKGGMRFMRRRPGDGGESLSVSSLVLGGEWRPAAYPGFSLAGEIEGDLADLSRLRGSLKASHKPTERLRLYTSLDVASDGSEFLDFSSGEGMKATMKAGVEYRLSENLTSFTEARSGSQTGLAGGLKGEWELREDSRFYAGVEHFQPNVFNGLRGSLLFDGASTDSAPQTSITAGYRAALKGAGRLALGAEASFRDGGHTFYTQQYWSRRLRDWTWALENRFAMADTDADRRYRDHLRAGAALRREDESVDALFLGGLRYDRDRMAGTDKTTAYWSAAGSLALGADARLTAKQAGQYRRKEIGDVSAESLLLLAQFGFEKDFMLRDDLRMRLGLASSVFYDVKEGRSHVGLGGEVGFVPAKNVLFSAGYNWSEVESESVSEIYRTGPYLRLSIKLDDTLWGFFERAGLAVPVDNKKPAQPTPVYK